MFCKEAYAEVSGGKFNHIDYPYRLWYYCSMAYEHLEAKPYFQEGVLSFDEARELIWRAGNIALGENPDFEDLETTPQSAEYNAHVSEIIGGLFDKVDSLERSSEALGSILPGDEVRGVTQSSLLWDMEEESEQILEKYQAVSETPIVHAHIKDCRLEALDMIEFCVSGAYSQLKAQQR